MHTIHLVFHMSELMSKYHSDGQYQPPLPLIELKGELEYEVEKIFNKRTRKIRRRDHIEYLIHWCGYDHEHDSWEPIRNLQHWQESIQAYEDSCRLMSNIGRYGTRRRR